MFYTDDHKERQDPGLAAQRELAEEIGYDGKIRLVPDNFLGRVRLNTKDLTNGILDVWYAELIRSGCAVFLV